MIDFARMRWLMRKVTRIQWEIMRKEANATRTTASITGMPRGGSGNRQEDAYIALADAQDAYREVWAELSAMRTELEPLIDRLEDPDERAVMRMRYLRGHKPEEIAAAIFRSDRSVYTYLKRAERRIRGGFNTQDRIFSEFQ